MFDVAELIIWLISGGGAGAVAYTIVDKVPWLTGLRPDYKRVVATLLTAAVAIGAFFFSGWLGTWVGPTGAQPITPQEWVVALLWIAGTANGWVLAIHTVKDLRQRGRDCG